MQLGLPLARLSHYQWCFVPAALRSCAMDAVQMVKVLVLLGSHLARLSRFQWFYEAAASRSGAMGADGT